MNTDNWKTATNGRDRKRSGRVGDSQRHNGVACEPNIVHIGSTVVDDGDAIAVTVKTLDIPVTIPVAMPVPRSADTKTSWADMSDSPDVSNIISAFMTEAGARCSNFGERISFVTSTTAAILDLGIKMIQDERNRIDASHNEKEFVRDLCNVCTHVKKLIDTTADVVSIVKKHMTTYESEKNSALDGLKTFLASIDQTMVPADPKPTGYANAAGGVRDQLVAKKPASQHLMASVPLGPGQMILPMTRGCDISNARGCDQSRNRSDIMPMSIKYASDLGVFLINIDGKLYSFCNGVFISRQSKMGDNTLYGKRCNPTSTRCIGANCTYYHDPLTHAAGHTMRNMGVHYVISELINGVANDAEIAETARGKNKYIVEDIVSLAGMLLIKAFQVKKIRDQYDA